MDEEQEVQVSLTTEEVEIIYSLLEQQVDSGDADESIELLLDAFKELKGEDND